MPGLQKCVSACVSLWVCVEGVCLVSAWKEGAPIQAAKILPRNLSGIVMFRQLHCDKIHSFHSATSFLLVTIVSLMPNWRRCLISTEWVKRCRCPEPQNHMLRVKGPRPHKAQLLLLWCGPIRGRRLKRVGEEHTEAPAAYKPLEGPADNGDGWRAGQGLTKGGASQEDAQHHFLLFFYLVTTFITIVVIFTAAGAIFLNHTIISTVLVIAIASPLAPHITKHYCIIMCFSLLAQPVILHTDVRILCISAVRRRDLEMKLRKGELNK